MGPSLFWSCVAHLVSLHSSYLHRTPREGVRSLSGFMNTYGRVLLYDIFIAGFPTVVRKGSTRSGRTPLAWLSTWCYVRPFYILFLSTSVVRESSTFLSCCEAMSIR